MEEFRGARIIPGYRQQKRNVLIAAAVFTALTAPSLILFRERSAAAQIFNLISVIGYGVLTLGWCYYDSLERNKPLGASFRILIVFFGVLALFIYLIKSRGIGRGSLSIGVSLLVIAGIVLIMGVSLFATVLIFGPDPRF